MRKPFVLVGLLLLLSGLALAQEPYPKIETSPAFMFIRTSPNISRTFILPNGTVAPGEDFNCAGGGGTITFNVNRFLGFGPDLGACKFFGNTIGLGNHINGYQATFLFGPRIAFRNSSRVTPFFDLQFGADRLSASCKNSSGTCVTLAGTGTYSKTAFALTAGGGIDIAVNRKLSIRLVQAEYLYTRFGNDCALAACSNNNNQNSLRLKSGIVMKWGYPPEAPATAGCSANPAAVDAGAPVQVSVTPGGFSPKRTLSYSYDSTGGKASGTGMTSTVDTTGLDAGSYTVTAKVMDNGKGKSQRSASCQATFAVNPKHPPVMSVTASPDSLHPGEPSTITVNGSSPDNRPLTYSCTATAGSLSGSGPRYALDTAGVPPGTITVNCTVSDDRNLTASGSTSVAVRAVPPPPVPQATKFGSVEFTHDVKRPTRVDNEAKGELDRYADALAAAPDSKGVVVGYATAEEDMAKKGKPAPDFAAKRAVNTKEYVTTEKGIDPARIEPRSGQGSQTADLWIVPPGATFPEAGTSPVDESKVKAVPRVANEEGTQESSSAAVAKKLGGRPQFCWRPQQLPARCVYQPGFFVLSGVVAGWLRAGGLHGS